LVKQQACIADNLDWLRQPKASRRDQGTLCLDNKSGVRLWQPHLRINKHAAMAASRYAHTKQSKHRHSNCACCARGSAASSTIAVANIVSVNFAGATQDGFIHQER
jgi:hypothetical protein